ncbi:hypothetical protein CK503_04075 [Aliifodinibius salipaludis]|uniref:site-specific DNA-methyltransferase (adenine-specific) n=1 Tax=Fodinibius salipaludis TaxID=2032627 RepID=A0A2A2GDW1_9BACT|nr:N-6 DNA methylase [Aliifodinibius salipaludis]PAU95380.1 hypothetical protein CK503_04075 [Aliifodinibius salipaludis]
MTLADAIGKILDKNERPMSISDLVDIGMYFEQLEVDEVTENDIIECVKENNDQFEIRNGFVSIVGQKYSEEDLSEIIERLRGEFGSEGYDLFIIMLFYFRYNATKEALELKGDSFNYLQRLLNLLKLPNNDLPAHELLEPFEMIFRDYFGKYPKDFADTEPIFEIHKFEVVGDNNLPFKFYNLLSNYDWSLSAVDIKTFDNFLGRIFENLVHRPGHNERYTPNKLSRFVGKLIDNGNYEWVSDLHTSYAELPAQFIKNNSGQSSISIAQTNPRILVLSALRLILLGIDEIKLLDHAFETVDNKYDLLLMNPPWGKLNKSFWKDKPDWKYLENVKSLEELFLLSGLGGLKEDGEAFIIIPNKHLFNGSGLLKNLAKKNNIKSIIYLPKSAFLPYASIETSILVLSKSDDKTPPLFINGRDISNKSLQDALDNILSLYKSKKEERGISRYVTWEEIEQNKFKFGPQTFFNPKVYSESYQRSQDEEILKLSEVSNRLKLPRKEVDGSYPLMNMSNLTDDPADFVLDISKRSTKSEYNSKLMVLDQDAVLIGKVGNNLKPSLFKYEGNPIYIGKNVIVLEPNKDVDPEYLISELNSEFVRNQITKLPKGSTIPNIRIRDLMDVYVRVPSLRKQASLFRDWIKKVAKSRVAEIENISSRLKLVEKDFLSGFKHDFMQILGNVSSGINNISNYIQSLNEKDVISLEEPVAPQFPGEEVKPEETIKGTLDRVQYNVQSAIDFLEVEMDRIVSGVDKSKFQEVELFQFLKDWKQGVNIDDTYSVRIEKSENWPSKGITVSLVPALFKTVLRNLLDNAIKHGFTEDKSDYEFVLTVGLIEESEGFFARLLIANNGKPFPDGYTFEDYLTARTSAGKNRGTGLGGAQIKRIVEELDGIFREPENPMPEEMWPVQFEILMPMIEE